MTYEFQTSLEIRVTYHYYHKEPRTHDDPGFPAHCLIRAFIGGDDSDEDYNNCQESSAENHEHRKDS